MNKKGFTLMELLGVIVILAVLLILAMPRIMKILENASQKAFLTEYNSLKKYVRLHILICL